jgi:hypothetical protein
MDLYLEEEGKPGRVKMGKTIIPPGGISCISGFEDDRMNFEKDVNTIIKGISKGHPENVQVQIVLEGTTIWNFIGLSRRRIYAFFRCV